MLTEQAIGELAADMTTIEQLEDEWKRLNDDRVGMRKLFPMGDMHFALPCNIDRLIWNAKKMFGVNARKQTDLNPLKAVEGVR